MNTIQQITKLVSALPKEVKVTTILYPEREKYGKPTELNSYPELVNILDLRDYPGFRYYDNLRENEHHIMIDTSFAATDLITRSLFGRGIVDNTEEFDKTEFEFTHPFKSWFPGTYKFPVYVPKKLGSYIYNDFINHYNGNWLQCCSYDRPRGHWKNQYTPYHRFFTGAHRVGSIFNMDTDSRRRITIVADSFGIPVIPYLAYYAKQVNFYDNRTNEPQWLELNNCTDLIVLCYERNLYNDNNAFYRSLKNATYKL